MSDFVLSARSIANLDGVKPDLIQVVHRAIKLTRIDFAVIEGVRTMARQEELVAKNLSQTMHSKHLTGDAVDLMAYVCGRGCWELAVYDDIADAVKEAAIECDVSIRWGGAWHIDDITTWEGSMEAAMNQYVDERRSKGRRPFIDGPHFELSGNACD